MHNGPLRVAVPAHQGLPERLRELRFFNGVEVLGERVVASRGVRVLRPVLAALLVVCRVVLGLLASGVKDHLHIGPARLGGREGSEQVRLLKFIDYGVERPMRVLGLCQKSQKGLFQAA